MHLKNVCRKLCVQIRSAVIEIHVRTERQYQTIMKTEKFKFYTFLKIEYKYRGEDPVFLQYGKEREIFIKPNQKDVIFPCLSYKREAPAKLAKRVVKDGKVRKSWLLPK